MDEPTRPVIKRGGIPANDTDAIYLRWRWIFVAGVLVGLPIGSLLGLLSAFIWLPLGAWATYQVWKDQQ